MCHAVPVVGRDGVVAKQCLRAAADAWATVKTEEAGDRALERVRLPHLLEYGAGVALHDFAENAEVSRTYWADETES